MKFAYRNSSVLRHTYNHYDKAINIINKYLKCAHESDIHRYYPVAASQIYNDKQLCARIIDFLGDIYIGSGLDVNQEENTTGAEIQDAIPFLAFCNGNA